MHAFLTFPAAFAALGTISVVLASPVCTSGLF